jgi:hypothetical protein
MGRIIWLGCTKNRIPNGITVILLPDNLLKDPVERGEDTRER